MTRVNRLRSAAAALRATLRQPPLGGKDFDEFPLQEDALQVSGGAFAPSKVSSLL